LKDIDENSLPRCPGAANPIVGEVLGLNFGEPKDIYSLREELGEEVRKKSQK
jgi:hypothetical protein